MKTIHVIAFILLIIGGLNWLLVGLFQWDISMIPGLGGMAGVIPRIIYVLVGLSAIWELCTHKKHCKCCTSSSSMATPTM